MKKNNWKSCVFWKIKYGFIGKILWKLFKYRFTLSRNEILYKYPNLENDYTKEIKNEFGENVKISFIYSLNNENDIDIYYIINGECKLYKNITILIPDCFCKRKFSKKDIERIGNMAKFNRRIN